MEIGKRADTPMQEPLNYLISVASSMSSEVVPCPTVTGVTERQDTPNSDGSNHAEDENGASLSYKDSHESIEKDAQTEQPEEECEDKDDNVKMSNTDTNQGSDAQPSSPMVAMYAGQDHDYRSETNAYGLFVGRGSFGWTPVNSKIGKLQIVASHQDKDEKHMKFLQDFLGPTMATFITNRYLGGPGEVWYQHSDQDQLCDCDEEEEYFDEDEEFVDEDSLEENPSERNSSDQIQKSAVLIEEEPYDDKESAFDPYGIAEFERLKTANHKVAERAKLPPQKHIVQNSHDNKCKQPHYYNRDPPTKRQVLPISLETLSQDNSQLLLRAVGKVWMEKATPGAIPRTSPKPKFSLLMMAAPQPKEATIGANKKGKPEPETQRVLTKRRHTGPKSSDDSTEDADEDIPVLEERYKFVKGGRFITLEDDTIVDQARYLRFRCELDGKVYVSQYFEKKTDLLDWNDKDCIDRLNHNAQQFFAKSGKGRASKTVVRWTDEEKQFIIDAVKANADVDVTKLHQAFNEKFAAKLIERTFRAVKDRVDRQIVLTHGHGKKTLKARLKTAAANNRDGMVGLEGDMGVIEESEEDDTFNIPPEAVAASSNQVNNKHTNNIAALDKEASDISANNLTEGSRGSMAVDGVDQLDSIELK